MNIETFLEKIKLLNYLLFSDTKIIVRVNTLDGGYWTDHNIKNIKLVEKGKRTVVIEI